MLALDAAVVGHHLIFNLGNGNRVSLREIVAAVTAVTDVQVLVSDVHAA